MMNSVTERRMHAAEHQYDIALQKLIGLLEDFGIDNYKIDKTMNGFYYDGLIMYQGKTAGYFQKADNFSPIHVRLDTEEARDAWNAIKVQMGIVSGEMMMDGLLTKEGY